MTTTHVLNTSCGVKIVAVFDDELLTFICQAVPTPPWNRILTRKVLVEFEPWRDNVFKEQVKALYQRLDGTT